MGQGKKTNYISTGGFSNRKEETDISPGLGLAIVGQFFWKAGKVFGIGLKVFISISKESPFSAIALNIAIGDLY